MCKQDESLVAVLPTSDPVIFVYLAHFMYFGHLDFIEVALELGVFTLEELWDQAKSLGMTTLIDEVMDMYVFLHFVVAVNTEY